ncbi:MAG: hypothetical protein ACO1RX_22695 [Candidatus Sericytochromatia bacterium]
MKRLILFSLLLTACSSQLPAVQPSAQPSALASVKPAGSQSSSTLFGDALTKRSLSLSLFPQNGNAPQNGDNATSNGATPPSPGRSSAGGAVGMARPEAAAGPVGMPAPGKMAADARGGIMMPWHGEFNQVTLKYAEENIYPKAEANSLVAIYNETVADLVKQWDSQARLLESRAQLGNGQGESFYLPGDDGKPEEVKVNFLYRLASSQRKETLVVYITDTQTRVHRLVWGEPQIDLNAVKLDSEAAQAKALAALKDTGKADYPVYPEQSQPEMQVITDIPADARWQVSLSQNSEQPGRYYVSVQFEADAKGQLPPDMPRRQMVYGSVELNAGTGEITQVNRPVIYAPFISARPGMAPMPVPMPLIAE